MTEQIPIPVSQAIDLLVQDLLKQGLQLYSQEKWAEAETRVQEALNLKPDNPFAHNRYQHYRQQLEPVIPILEPTIKRLGYEIA